MTPSPCKGCQRRFVGCHSECESYLEWQKIHAQEKARQWLYYAGANDAAAITKDRLNKIGKRLKSKRRVGQI